MLDTQDACHDFLVQIYVLRHTTAEAAVPRTATSASSPPTESQTSWEILTLIQLFDLIMNNAQCNIAEKRLKEARERRETSFLTLIIHKTHFQFNLTIIQPLRNALIFFRKVKKLFSCAKSFDVDSRLHEDFRRVMSL